MEKLTELSHLLVTVFLSSFASLMVIPAITDVTMVAVCPGKDECSLAIYLSGFQQAIIGLGTVVMMPLIGNLSDQYGRKALLTLPMTLSIIPLVILAYSRTTNFFYAYYVLRTLTAMICEGSINCLALAYVADNVLERQRTSAFGILSGIATAAFVCGTLAARFLSTALTFQVAALVSMLAAVYMRIFLEESLPNGENLTQPILKSGQDDHCQDCDLSRKAPVSKKIPSIQDIIGLLKSRVTFSQAAVVAFFNSLAEGGMQASIMYYLKARFHFSKNHYADLMLLLGVAGMASQLVFMPLLAPHVAEEKLLAIGLLGGIADALLYSVAWSNWVPYATTIFAVFIVCVPPCLRSIASKQVGPTEQGKAQGCISGIMSFANIISPLIFSPLTALFLSEDAPFHFPGFSILCIGFATMIAFFQSVLMRGPPPISSHKICSNSLVA
ncbi:hippocampus abundant transcript-like protein 1 [Populus alba x Populus x berolinensis]|uniref:Hippocampus abundant transcript-like protein 1 n=1 Tax=Populus alba TaxID=43335 RepID=A0A4U5QUQ6_POPAL|nr:hippocampus abundant transcript-like protein 1 [Populus alba]XP_034903238.1 hippocampus abundant transcript-like protein 1 [Populus alba]KAJ6937199.1 hippocampus abundant transcript-like protein 1 [Populus alba x Populus x berolinensis]TKS14768.1 hippocampus abundant transcript-like protein 1 [Populus alba]